MRQPAHPDGKFWERTGRRWVGGDAAGEAPLRPDDLIHLNQIIEP